jgi:hypothetical protein
MDCRIILREDGALRLLSGNDEGIAERSLGRRGRVTFNFIQFSAGPLTHRR